MTLPEILAECEKLVTPHKHALISKLKVAISILQTTEGAEHLLTAPEKPPEPTPEPTPDPPHPRKTNTTRRTEPMTKGR